MKKLMFLLILMVSFGAVACAAPEADGSGPISANNETGATHLTDGYNDALPVLTQLAVGTLQLDATELAVDEALAAEILPLWQAAQSLSNSDTAASAEVTAVLTQIQDAMSQTQISAIVDMALTTDSITELLESGAVTFGRGVGGRPGQEDGQGEGFTPPAGGRLGQGGGRPDGAGGIGGGNLSEDDIATRQAEIASGEGFAGIQDQAMVGAVVRLLQTKTGEVGEGASVEVNE